MKPVKAAPTLWRGPEEDGITFSMLSKFLVCRERFRVLVVEGLRPAREFNHKIEYGQMWHTCEEAHAAGAPWQGPLMRYCRQLCQAHPQQQEQVDHWYNVCKLQFPLYVKYWAKHADVRNRTPLLQEQVFNVPYRLPTGRTVRLRGKLDSVDLETGPAGTGVWLQENKTKSDINEEKLRRQLTFDLQTMLYLVALDAASTTLRLPGPIHGVRYNVVRRPLSGGKGSIVRHKPTKKNPHGESKAEYYARVAAYIEEEPHHYFARWKITVVKADIDRFRRECLDPLLVQLCNWWEWVRSDPRFDPFTVTAPSDPAYGIHWRHPFGVYNVLDEGGSTDLDGYLETGSKVGLEKADSLFKELE